MHRIAGVEIGLGQHRARAESVPRRSGGHLEGLHRLFLHAHVDVGGCQLEVLLRRFGRSSCAASSRRPFNTSLDAGARSQTARRRSLFVDIVKHVAQIDFMRPGAYRRCCGISDMLVIRVDRCEGPGHVEWHRRGHRHIGVHRHRRHL